MKKLSILLITLFIFAKGYSQQDSQVYYIMPDKQIFNANDFNSIVDGIDKQGAKVKLLDTIQKDGNSFVNVAIKAKDVSRSPYKKFIDMVGQPFPLESFGLKKTGKPMMINFWFTSCGPCIKEIPDLNALKETFDDKVDFYAITFNTKTQVEKFEEKRPVHFNHITDQRTALGKFGVRSYPMNMVLDADGNISFVSGMVGNGLNEFIYEINKTL